MSKLKSCPFCGNEVYVEKRPLWRTTDSGTTHGYYDCYEFDIRCTNPDCGCNVNLGKNDTIYRPEEEALQNAINAWNKRTDCETRMGGEENGNNH